MTTHTRTLAAAILALSLFGGATNAFARISDPCTEDSHCDATLVCIQNNCLPDGDATVTISWTTKTDVDIKVVTPDDVILSPNIDDTTMGGGGSVVRDECYGERCRDTEASLAHPHVEHIVFDGPDVKNGTYLLSASNFDGFSDAEVEITIRTACGELYDQNAWGWNGDLSATAGEETPSFSFEVECYIDELCKDSKDTDGDGLCDDWETDGIDVDNDGTIDLVLNGADPEYKDIYVEVDYLKGQSRSSLSAMISAFANADVENPNGKKGINLHVQYDDEVTSISGSDITETLAINLSLVPAIKWADTSGADATSCGSGGWFGTDTDRAAANCENIINAKKLVYRYIVYAWAHTSPDVLGISELPGNDSLVTAGHAGFDTTDMVAVAMHEFGHALGLMHGGPDHTLCKPNHLSIMNYTYTLDDLVPTRPLDYSSQNIPSLFENNLVEENGVAGPMSWPTVLYGSLAPTTGPVNAMTPSAGTAADAIDWENDGESEDTVSGRVSHFREFGFCADAGRERALHTHHDWKSIRYNFRDTAAGQTGAYVFRPFYAETFDLDAVRAAAATLDSDADGVTNDVDLCPGVADDQSDRDNDGVGDACDACPDDAAPGFGDGCFEEIPKGEANADTVAGIDRSPSDDPTVDDSQLDDDDDDAPRKYGSDDGLLSDPGGCTTTGAIGTTPLWWGLLVFGLRRRKKKN